MKMKRSLLLLAAVLLIAGCGAKKPALPAEDAAQAESAAAENVSDAAEGEAPDDLSGEPGEESASSDRADANPAMESLRSGGDSGAGEYIFPESNIYPISVWEVSGLSPELCRLGRNEIFARRGRIFEKDNFRNYFESKSWYKGTIRPEDFHDSWLNLYERRNVRFLMWAEKEFAFGLEPKDVKEYAYIGNVDSTSEFHPAETEDRIRITAEDSGNGTIKAVYNGSSGNEWSEKSGKEISFTLSDGREYQSDEEFYYDVSFSRDHGMLYVYEDGADCFWVFRAK